MFTILTRLSAIFGLMFLLFCTHTGQAQSLQLLEYYFDQDPGFGQGSLVNLTGTVSNAQVDPDVSALTPGFHNLFIRVRDNQGRWSLTHSRLFYKGLIANSAQRNITQAEYFFDHDPGFGLGTSLGINGNLINQSYAVDVSQLTPGFHMLYMRVRDQQGKWSLTHTSAFYIGLTSTTSQRMITGAEYFLDSDPGFGLGTPIAMNGNLVDQTYVVDVSQLAPGFHTLYMRVRDQQGNWSLTHTCAFYKGLNTAASQRVITGAEYFLNSDPGFGRGISIAMNGNLVDESYLIDVTQLNPGFHTLYMRVRDQQGKWSLTHTRPFYKNANNSIRSDIVRIEYFFDQDPGLGLGLQVPINQAPFIDSIIAFDIRCLSEGLHRYFIRTQDEAGWWSVTYYDTITVNRTAFVSAQICDGDSFVMNGISYHQTGTYRDTLLNNAGCDSMVQLHLEVFTLPIVAMNVQGSQVICSGDTLLLAASLPGANIYQWFKDGQLLPNSNSSLKAWEAGTYFFVAIDSQSSCRDTSALTTITVNPSPVAPTITISVTSDTLFSSATTGNQWYRNGSQITGATDPILVITQNGSYYTTVTNTEGCESDSSNVVNVVNVSLEEWLHLEGTLYPNPASGYAWLAAYLPETGTTSIEIYNSNGQLVYQQILPETGGAMLHELKIGHLTNGVYIIKLQQQRYLLTKRLFIRK
jgi:hypothetical protein